MQKCKRCGLQQHIPAEMRPRIRKFKEMYPWVHQKDLAEMMGVTQMRMSEIIRADKAQRGD